MSTLPLSIVILTYNEERNLSTCLRSIQRLTKEIFVVDSGSEDDTKKIAEDFGAHFTEHPFKTHTQQWSWALANLPLGTEWVLGLDADQRVTKELREELIQLFTSEVMRLKEADGFYVKRRQIFRGRWIRHGGYYPKYLLKLFRRDKIFMDPYSLVDHHFYVAGRTEKLKGDIVEENRKENDLQFWMEKHRRYAELQAQEELYRRKNGRSWPILPSLKGSADQRTLWFKKLWYRSPLYLRSFAYFFYRYFLKLGFLDGKEGLTFHFLHGLWYRLFIDRHLSRYKKRRSQKQPSTAFAQ